MKETDASVRRREWLALETVETLLGQLVSRYPDDGLMSGTHDQVIVLADLAEARHLDALVREAEAGASRSG